MERAGDGVLLAGDEVLVGHGIDHGGRLVGHDGLVTVHAVLGGGADFRCDDAELLVHVILVPVVGDEGGGAAINAVKLLVDRDGLPAQLIGGEGHLHDLVARGALRREVLGGADILAVNADGVAGGGVNDRGHEAILTVHHEAVIGHLVRDGHIADVDAAVAVGRVVGVGGDGCGALRHVVEGAEVIGHAMAGDHDGRADQRVALVVGAGQLLDGVGVIGERAEGVARLGHGALGGEAEPDTCGRVELGTVDGAVGVECPVVAVGVLGVLVPRGGGVEVAVLVGHDDMALAGGLGGHLERDVGEAVGAVMGLLVELKVGALDLIVDMAVPGDRVHDFPVLGDVELVGGAVGEVVALTGLDLLQRVLAVGERVGRGGRVPVLDGEGRHDVALGVEDAADLDRVLAERLDLELGAVDGRSAQRGLEVALKVALVDLDAAAHHVVAGGEVVDRTVLADRGMDFVRGVQVALVGPGLADDVAAVGERVARSGGMAVLVGGHGRHDRSGGVLPAVHDDGVAVVVDDGERDALEARIALRGLAGLGVQLPHGHAATNHRLGNFGEIEGSDSGKRLLLNLLEVHVIIQLVAGRSLRFINDNGTTRECDTSVIVVESIAGN